MSYIFCEKEHDLLRKGVREFAEKEIKPIAPELDEKGESLFCYTNGLFLDWSVRKIGLKELWTLKWEPWFDTAGEWTRADGVQPDDWPKWMRNFKDY